MYKFIKTRDTENRHDVTNVTFAVDSVTLSDLISEFELFLKACGFVFKGSLDVVEPDEPTKVDNE